MGFSGGCKWEAFGISSPSASTYAWTAALTSRRASRWACPAAHALPRERRDASVWSPRSGHRPRRRGATWRRRDKEPPDEATCSPVAMHRGGAGCTRQLTLSLRPIAPPCVALCKHLADKRIILAHRVWNIPEHDLPAFLQASGPLLLRGDHDDQIGGIDHGRGELLSPLCRRCPCRMHSRYTEVVRSCPTDAGDVFECSASEVLLGNELVRSNSRTVCGCSCCWLNRLALPGFCQHWHDRQRECS